MKIFKIIIVVILVTSVLVIGYFAIFPHQAPYWTGIGPYNESINGPRAKTLWDWLELLIIPSTLGLIGWLYGDYQRAKDEKKETEDKLNVVLDSYLKALGELITKSNLLSPNSNKETKGFARTRTVVALENLDGERKGQILQFLYESKLINKPQIVDLNGANFKSSQIESIVLRGAVIKGAHFNDSNLSSAYLDNANLAASNFENSSFFNSSMENTDLAYANLTNCNLRNIDLSTVNFEGANLTNADLRNSKISSKQLKLILNKNGVKTDKL